MASKFCTLLPLTVTLLSVSSVNAISFLEKTKLSIGTNIIQNSKSQGFYDSCESHNGILSPYYAPEPHLGEITAFNVTIGNNVTLEKGAVVDIMGETAAGVVPVKTREGVNGTVPVDSLSVSGASATWVVCVPQSCGEKIGRTTDAPSVAYAGKPVPACTVDENKIDICCTDKIVQGIDSYGGATAMCTGADSYGGGSKLAPCILGKVESYDEYMAKTAKAEDPGFRKSMGDDCENASKDFAAKAEQTTGVGSA